MPRNYARSGPLTGAVQLLVVGGLLGATATAGHALLLYTGGGFLRAVGFLFALTLGAMAMGLWAGQPDRVRPRPALRWAAMAISLAVAGAFTMWWNASDGLRSSGLGTGLAALFILAEPAYAGGALLAMLAHRRTGQAPIALAGLALGVVAAASVVIPRVNAPIVFLGAAGIMALAGVFTHEDDDDDALPERSIDMKDRVAIISGVSARGQVGFTLADRFLREGARVIVTGRTPAVEQLARELASAGEVAAVVADLTHEQDVARLVATAAERFGRLDAVINVAGGLSVIKPLSETTAREWNREIERNAETVLRVSTAALPLLRESGGAIVNFASPAGIRAVRQLGAYSAAKAAVVALTRAMALEEKVFGVRVNAIAPGMIDTDQNRGEMQDSESARFVTREEIAEVALFLASDASSGISGETIHVLGEGLR